MDPRSLSRDELVHEAWRRGRLRWLLHSSQQGVYDAYRAWEKLDPSTQHGNFARVFVLDIGKRWGKTTKRFTVRVEDCIRNPGRSYRYASAYQKNIEEIVDEVAQRVFDTCPKALRPRYRQGGKADGDNDPRRAGTGFYFPERDGKVSVLKLVGLDKDPDGLRGRASDGDDISEAAFVRHLRYSVKNVLYHQYQGRPWARMCMESSAPREPDSEYDNHFVEDAKARGAYAYRTIDDNPMLSPSEREEFIRAAGGREHPDCQIEYFNKRVRDPVRTIVPEFNRARHVRLPAEFPAHALALGSIDPGVSHLCGLLWAYWDFMRQKLVVQRSWAESNANTNRIAAVLSTTDAELWSRLQYWDGVEMKPNPARRVSDTDLRLILDLRALHGVDVVPTAKDNARAALQELRNAFLRDDIEIVPNSGPLEAQLNAGMWNEKHSAWEVHPVHGHFDCVAALVYLWRAVAMVRNTNPTPPEGYNLSPRTHWFSPKAPVATVPREYQDLAAAWPTFQPGGGR